MPIAGKCGNSSRSSSGNEEERRIARLVVECGRRGDVSEGRALHSRILRSPWLSGSKLLARDVIAMYCRCGVVEEARRAFDSFRHGHARKAWNTLIAAYAQKRQMQRALQLFEEMHGRDAASWNAALKAHAAAGDVARLRLRFARMPMHDVVSGNTLALAFAALGQMRECEQAVDGMAERNAVTWTALMTGHAQNGDVDAAKRVFDVAPTRDIVCWAALAQALLSGGRARLCKAVFERMPAWSEAATVPAMLAHARLAAAEAAPDDHDNIGNTAGGAKQLFDAMQQRSIASWTGLSQAYLLCSQLQGTAGSVQAAAQMAARRVLDRMPQHDLVCWTGLLSGYAASGQIALARQVFDSMAERNVVSWRAMLHAYESAGDAPAAERMFRAMPQHDAAACTIMLVAFAQSGDLQKAEAVHGMMQERNVMADTAMLSAYATAGDAARAKTLFDSMPEKNVVSWTSMAAAFAQCGQGSSCKHAFDRMPARNLVSYITMLVATSSCGLFSFHDAKAVFDSIPEPDIVCWTALLQSACSGTATTQAVAPGAETAGAAAEATAGGAAGATAAATAAAAEALETVELLFRMMFLEGDAAPNEVAYLCVLGACSHAGRVELGRRYFVAMSADHGLQPSREHYSCLVDMLARSGQLAHARQLLHDMPFRNDEVALGVLLSASALQRDEQLGTAAAATLLQLQPHRASNYLLLRTVLRSLV